MFGNFLYLLEESTEAVKTCLRMQNQHQSGTMNNLASRRVVQDYLHTSPASSSNLPNMPNPRDSAVTRPPVPVRPVSPPKSTASEQGCRCNAVDDIETPAGFCLNIQNQSVRKPAPTAPVTAEKATKEETAATTKMEERSALEPDSPEAKNEAGNVSIAMPPPQPPLQRADALLDSSQGTLVPKDSDDEPRAWIRRALRRQKRQTKEKPHVHRESSVEDSSQRNIAMRIFNGVVTKSS